MDRLLEAGICKVLLGRLMNLPHMTFHEQSPKQEEKIPRRTRRGEEALGVRTATSFSIIQAGRPCLVGITKGHHLRVPWSGGNLRRRRCADADMRGRVAFEGALPAVLNPRRLAHLLAADEDEKGRLGG